MPRWPEKTATDVSISRAVFVAAVEAAGGNVLSLNVASPSFKGLVMTYRPSEAMLVVEVPGRPVVLVPMANVKQMVGAA